MIQDILKLKAEGVGYRKIAERLNLSKYKVEKILQLLKEYGESHLEDMDMEDIFPSEADKSEKVVKKDREIQKLRSELQNLKKQYKHSLKEVDRAHGRSNVMDLFEENNDHSLIMKEVENFPQEDEDVNRAVAFLIASDWHVEELVDPTTINGLNEFNLEICEQRIKTFFKNGVNLINKSKVFNQIDTVVLGILGDIISGYIHDELIESNECSPTQAIIFADKMLTAGIHYILENTDIKKLLVPCCFGNHGRTNVKKKISTSYKNSFEWLMYQNMKERFADHDKVDFIVENGIHVYMNVFDNYVIRFHHGDSMRYGGGVGGLTIPVNKSINQWNKIKHAYLDVFGHFHQLKDNGNFIVNGCFTENMNVTMGDGVRKPIKDIEIGDKVLTRTGEPHKVVNKMTKHHQGQLINFRFQGKQFPIECTPNHEIWAIKSNQLEQTVCGKGTNKYYTSDNHIKPQWIHSEFLSKGDYVHLPYDKTIEDNPEYSLEMCRLFGFYLAEGSISRRYSKKENIDKLNQLVFTFHIDEVAYGDFVKETLENNFDCHVGVSSRESKTTRTIRVSREHISQYFYDRCGKGSHTKRMSDELMKLPPKKQEQILIGWLSGDGCINKGDSAKGRFRTLSGATVSFDLACQLFMISLRCGYHPKMYKSDKNSQRKSDCYQIQFSKKDMQRLSKKINPAFFVEEDFRETRIGMITHNGEVFAPISEIWSSDFDGEVYDLEIDTEHSYVVQGVGVHNSLVGYNAFALSIKADYEEPKQAFFLIDEEYGKTLVHPIFCKEDKSYLE